MPSLWRLAVSIKVSNTHPPDLTNACSLVHTYYTVQPMTWSTGLLAPSYNNISLQFGIAWLTFLNKILLGPAGIFATWTDMFKRPESWMTPSSVHTDRCKIFKSLEDANTVLLGLFSFPQPAPAVKFKRYIKSFRLLWSLSNKWTSLCVSVNSACACHFL